MSAAAAAVAVAAVIASFCVTDALCAMAGAQNAPAIASALFAIALTRRGAAPANAADLALGVVRLAFLALVAAGAGLLFHRSLALGAVAFVAVLSLSVWMRDFGERARAAGALIALPLIALLVVPAGPPHARGGPAVDIALIAAAGIVALLCASAAAALAVRFGLTERPRLEPRAVAPRAPGLALTPAARMALQLAVALTAAFVLGDALFPDHWGWCVLTAFIVCAGARGRGDALYRGVLRLGGALAGSVAAAVVGSIWAPEGVWEAVVIFAVLYLGTWLRERNYAYWAGAMTLIFALLARGSTPASVAMLAERLAAILTGAVCAVVAAWFVTPIRTEAVIRRRLADALLALDEVIVHGAEAEDERARRLASFEDRLDQLEQVAPPVRWHRRLFARREQPEHPAGWIDVAGGLREHAPRAHQHPNRGAIRRAIGATRRAIANHGKPVPVEDAAANGVVPSSVTASLAALHDTFRPA